MAHPTPPAAQSSWLVGVIASQASSATVAAAHLAAPTLLAPYPFVAQENDEIVFVLLSYAQS